MRHLVRQLTPLLILMVLALFPHMVLAQEGDIQESAASAGCSDTWIVRPGDTLYEIARTCNTTVDALLAANPQISSRALIIIGQEITIPQEGTTPPGRFTPEPAPINISPMSGAPGTQVTVQASGFEPGTPIDIGFGPWQSEYEVIGTALAEADGTVSAVVSVPEYATAEQEWVFVAAAPGEGRSLTSQFFNITADGPAPTEPPAQFTRANIYLIAVDDGGQAGAEVGCNDSLVPVEVTFAPTVAPLTAALEELFTIDSRMYGQSGLYNPLYRSDLAVEGIDIEANGEARIELTGSITIGGTCDVPRVEEMLRQTALQYSTINEVTILVNGEPLSDAL